uniref:Jun dimerization protein 2 n=1 Tax=Monodelphis domestica TaxID=13616 RepID=A0A5F8H3Y9_MONDO
MQPIPPPATACGRDAPGQCSDGGAVAAAEAAEAAEAAAAAAAEAAGEVAPAVQAPRRLPGQDGPGHGNGALEPGGSGTRLTAVLRLLLQPCTGGAASASSLCTLDEEEERRKRRREKNKVAAARCRNKKKERTEFLQRESERLELMNAELKAQIEELKQERQQLILMLNRHRPTCIVRTDSVKTPESEANPLLEQLEKK